DPVYRAIVTGGLSNRGGSLVDIGCGQGLLLSVLIQAQRLWADGAWPAGTAPPPRFDRMLGIELRPRVVQLARRALGPGVELVSRDARQWLPESADAVVCVDVLHMLSAQDQERVITKASAALTPGGIILIRDADPSGGWGFTAVRVGNRLKSIVSGRWRQAFHFRTSGAWAALLEREGLRVTVQPMREGTPFANFLMSAVRSAEGSALHVTADPNDGGSERLRRDVKISTEPERAGDG
ncbi:MAG: class I SAM-dependent methyltransferase, partial [Vicinamibacterales bacterium]